MNNQSLIVWRLPPARNPNIFVFSEERTRRWSQLIHSLVKEYWHYLWCVPLLFETDPTEPVRPANWISEPRTSFCNFRNCGSYMISGEFLVSESAIKDFGWIFSDPPRLSKGLYKNIISRKTRHRWSPGDRRKWRRLYRSRWRFESGIGTWAALRGGLGQWFLDLEKCWVMFKFHQNSGFK